MTNDTNIKNFTTADIEKYHQGLLSPLERHGLEKAALDDPFLADALEGYGVAGIDHSADIAELKKKLSERVEGAKLIPLQGGSRNTFPWLRAAAIIIVIAGAGLLVYQFAFNNKGANESLAVADTKKTEGSKSLDTVNNSVPASGGKRPTRLLKNLQIKNGSPGFKACTTGNTISKNEEGAGLGKTDSSREYYYTTIDKPAAPIMTTLPKGADEKNKQPGTVSNQPEGLFKNGDKREVAKEDAKNKTSGNIKTDAEKDELRAQSIQETEEYKKNRNVAATRRADDQLSRNITTNTFRGQVTDASNVGVPFAKVTNAQDNDAGTYTDARGNFNLTSLDTVLNVQVKSVGFENNNVQLHNNVPNNKVVLQDERKSLSDVVISDQKPNAAARSRDANMKLEEPEPADGWENYDTYLTNNLNVPDNFKPKQTSNASVEISFEVDKKGEPVNIKVKKSLCAPCDKEAVRLVKEGPKWKRNAKKSRTTVTIPFNAAAQ